MLRSQVFVPREDLSLDVIKQYRVVRVSPYMPLNMHGWSMSCLFSLPVSCIEHDEAAWV